MTGIVHGTAEFPLGRGQATFNQPSKHAPSVVARKPINATSKKPDIYGLLMPAIGFRAARAMLNR